jgi:hypothetical protein
LVADAKGRRSAGATLFPELNELLATFVDSVEAILGSQLAGVYLTGSFALRSADAASDCDFLVVTSDHISAEQEQLLRRLHEQVLTWPGYWAYNLEGSYAPQGDLETLATLGRPWLYVNRGARELEWSSHCNTEDVRWVFYERALTLAGTDPREFACPVPASLLQRKMRSQIEGFLDDLLSWTSFDVAWTPRYAVEATSRMLYTLERGEVIAKQDALAWAAETMPAEWRDLIDQVRQDRLLPWNDPPRPQSVARSLAFIEYVQQQAASKGSRIS